MVALSAPLVRSRNLQCMVAVVVVIEDGLTLRSSW
jgi:hypothetical protein